SAEELEYFQENIHLLQADTSEFFATSSLCINCHSFDPDGRASVDAQGNDVNVVDDWRASMMANSARDPFWRAKVSHEVLVNPSHKVDIETSCTSCHAPLGHYRAVLTGSEHYLISDMLQDTFGIDGVSCGACHQQSEEQIGLLNSGKLNYDTSRVIYGPYLFPFEQPMELFVGYKPVWSEHINDAGLCASCHTLIVNSLDLEGNPTGTSFVEQATYHEWLNSDYNAQDVSCQSCHIPRIDDKVIIARSIGPVTGREPYGLHEMAGANTFMLQLMKENRDELGIPATEANFDSTLTYTYEMLQQKTLAFEMELDSLGSDTAYFSMTLRNLAGHKFPSGYPSRRAFIEFVVLEEDGDTLFQSGVLDDTYEVMGMDDHYEPHYDIIRSPDQVQIYELVNADVEGQFSTVLERGFQALKDNRLPPLGFSRSHPVYDTTQIAGLALDDTDFNQLDGQEGSGGDRIRYHIPLAGYAGGSIRPRARVLYQSLPPKWMAEMFATTTPEIETFRNMYDRADQSAVVVASQDLDPIYIRGVGTRDLPAATAWRIGPNPSSDGWLNVVRRDGSSEVAQIEVFDTRGSHLASHRQSSFFLPDAPGIYLLRIYSAGQWWTSKVIRN
ncbi:MAG: T9SS type A sorting domain-containing protein, partial [Bacteroidota bacterium]